MSSMLSSQQFNDLHTMWKYLQLNHEPRRCSAAVALGGFDLGVPSHSASLFAAGYFPVIVFTGATSATTVERFPQGEAVAFRDHARHLGVPHEAILTEPEATNTGENVRYSRRLLNSYSISISELLVICMPSMQRRAYATFAKQWPEVSVICASKPTSLAAYLEAFEDEGMVIDELVGDTQRIWRHAEQGFAIEQPLPVAVHEAYCRLVRAGFDRKIIS